ncbi:MAG: hypothetical protein ACXIU8_16535 [Alkalilacustris sp.]
MQAQSQPASPRRSTDELAALRAEVRALHAILPGLTKPARPDTHKGG